MLTDQQSSQHVVDSTLLALPPNSHQPNYTGGGIVNLMASIAEALGTDSQWATADILNDKPLGRRVVMLVIDGLGIDHLQKGLPNGYLAQHCIGELTSVSPSATAAAIPSYLTGEPPAVHGFPGWFTWFEEIATTAAILPFATRAAYLPLSKTAMTPALLSGVEAFTSKIDVPSWTVSPKRIAHSTFSTDFRGNSTILAYNGIDDLVKNVHKACTRFNDSGYVYAYWSDYDHIAHGYGVGSAETQAQLEMLDNKIEKLATKLNGLDIDLLVCADHGFIDCPDDKQYILERDFPQLHSLLKMPLTGEPRLATAHLKNGAVKDFHKISEELLQGIATVVNVDEYVGAGMLGGRQIHPQLLNRMGDVALLMHENTVLFDPLAGESAPRLIGHHGGLSPNEMRVPLIRCSC